MTSKEKINSIKSVINEFYHDMNCKENLTECANECWKEYQQFCEDIKQDLDKLEKLEKENQNLKEKLKRFIPKIVVRNTFDNVIPSLEEENEKLKKVMEILKSKNVYITKLIQSISLEDYNELVNGWYELGSDELTQEEYDLLKEYFGNE